MCGNFFPLSSFMKIIGSRFVRSERKKCFNQSDIEYLKRQGFVEGTKKDGFVYMVKPVVAYILVETEGGVPVKQDMREQILKYYGLKSLKLERFNMFLSDVLRGKIALNMGKDGTIEIR